MAALNGGDAVPDRESNKSWEIEQRRIICLRLTQRVSLYP
jgi:hypothetical protein